MMLLQLLMHQPQAIGQVLRNTPVWVWALLAGLAAVGFAQAKQRTASRARIALLPVAMTLFTVSGLVSTFGATPLLAGALFAWLVSAAGVFALVAPGRASGTYDAASRSFALPGSWVPLALILATFLVKYAAGVELAMQPAMARTTGFALGLAALYGVFSGIFAGRAARLLRLARQPSLLPA